MAESHLQNFAESVAVRVAGPQGSDDDVSLDLPALIELVMQVVMTMLDSCKANDSQVVKAITKPGIIQRARFKAQVFAACSSCHTSRWRDQSGAIAEAMLQQASDMNEAEVNLVVFETRHDDWILV